MSKRMTDDELTALTDAEMRQSVGFWGGKLAQQRQKAERYYLGLATGDLAPPEIEGRSSVVSPDVRNTIESMLPQLMVKFVGGDEVIKLEPTKPGDEEQAKADTATEYLNYLFFSANDGHDITATWFKDGLLQKNGIIKVWWDTRTEETREEYAGLDDVELAQIMDDDEVEVTEHTATPDDEDAEQRKQATEQLAQQLQEASQAAQQGNQRAQQAAQEIMQQLQQIKQTPKKMLHDVTCKRAKKGGKICIENVPPEELLINRTAKNISDARFVGHRRYYTMSDLKSMGYDTDKIEMSSDDSAAMANAERIERMTWDDEFAYMGDSAAGSDDSQRQVWVTECYIRCDYDGDGISELRRVLRAGNAILENEVVDIAPFASVTPIPLPHRFFGLSIHDVAQEAQRVKTSILRAYLDNLYLQVNGRYFAVDNQVNLDDLLTSRPGGVVRIKQQGTVGRLDQGMADGADALKTLEYMEEFLEQATGWTKYSQGNDSKGLNDTATGVNIITNRGDMRLDLIARHFASGFRDLFRLLLRLVCKYQKEARDIKLSKGWTKIDPREWRNGFDMSINIGLGTGNKDQLAAHVMNILAIQEKAIAVGVATPENIYHAGAELTKLAGFKDPDRFFTDPATQQPVQPPPDPEQIKAQSAMQMQQAKLQADAQTDAQRLQHEKDLAAFKSQQEMAIEQHQQQMQAEQVRQQNELEAQRDALASQNQMQLEQIKIQTTAEADVRRLEFERWKADLDAATRIQVAQISAQTALDTASLAAQTAAANKVTEDEGGKVAEAESKPEDDKHAQTLQVLQSLVQQLAKPKTIIRGADGRATGVQ